MGNRVVRPSEVSDEVGLFDKFASASALVVSRAPFFAFCVILILLWAPTMLFMQINTSQLIINTVTTIITFLLVALLQNSQTRSDNATQHKLNAIAEGLATLLEGPEADELYKAVGLEQKESA